MSIEDDATLYYGFIYVTTNLVNDMKYIGRRKYTNHYKWYLGSGKLLKRDIKKYGAKNFRRDIIENCISEQELNQREHYWIEYYNAYNRSDFYNIVPGGIGGGGVFNYLSESQQKEIRNKVSERVSGNKNPRYGRPASNKTKKLISDKLKNLYKNEKNNPMLGRTGINNPNSLHIVCVETGDEYYGIREASRQTKIPAPNIIKSIHSDGRLSAGKSSNGERLHWKLVEVVN